VTKEWRLYICQDEHETAANDRLAIRNPRKIPAFEHLLPDGVTEHFPGSRSPFHSFKSP